MSEPAKRVKIGGIRQIAERALQLGDVIRFELGEPDFDTPENIRKAAVEAMERGHTHYTSIYGTPELRQAIAEKLERENGIEADPNREILVTCGGYQALFAAFCTLLNPGDEVILTDPHWSAYRNQLDYVGARVKYVSLREDEGFVPRIEDVEAAVTERTKMIVINTPQNPTGAVWDRKELGELAELAVRKDLIILSDEVYERLVFDGRKHFSVASIPDVKERVVSVFSFSKTYAMTGWRLGYIVANSTFVDHMKRLTYITTVCPNSIAQYAAIEALRGPQDAVKRMVDEYERRRDLVHSELMKISGVRCFKPKGTFYVFPDFSEIMKDSWKLAMYLLENARVSVVPGVAFGPEAGEGHVRISFATSRENIIEGIRRIREAVSSL